jgi:N-acylneuraminate cytidylyltransferase
MKIAVIPARGGSKRIPRKNIKPFCGKPMIAWSIEASKESGLFDHIFVSTDDAEIAEIARAYGAESPFVRPPELSNDYAGTTEVIAHATQWALNEGLNLQAVCCIYATAPLIQIEDLIKGWDVFSSGGWEYVFSASEFEASVFRAFKKNSDGGVEMIFPEYFASRSQDLPITYHDAGQYYWGRPESWIEGRKIFGGNSAPINLPKWRVQDIDNSEDWLKAELIFNQLGNIKNGKQ